jgi:hypothetical protein
MLIQSGFTDVAVESKDESKTVIKDWVPGLTCKITLLRQ